MPSPSGRPATRLISSARITAMRDKFVQLSTGRTPDAYSIPTFYRMATPFNELQLILTRVKRVLKLHHNISYIKDISIERAFYDKNIMILSFKFYTRMGALSALNFCSKNSLCIQEVIGEGRTELCTTCTTRNNRLSTWCVIHGTYNWPQMPVQIGFEVDMSVLRQVSRHYENRKKWMANVGVACAPSGFAPHLVPRTTR